MIYDKIDQIFEKHTKALTKTTQNGREVVSFDTLVVDAYEIKTELAKLFKDESKAQLIELLDGFIMDLLVIGKTYPPEKQISEFAKKLKEERQKL